MVLAGSLSAETNVLVLAGSTRFSSYNKKLAQTAAQLATNMGGTVTFIDLKDYPMPLYDADLESSQGMPANAKKLRDAMIASQAIVIASPEYNASIPAVLKNALDWASRNEAGEGSRDAFLGKKFAIMSASPGQGGGARGLVHLQAILEEVGGQVVDTKVVVPRVFMKNTIGSPEVQQQLQQELSQLFE